MTRHFLIGAVLVAIVNGIFSPYVLSVFLFYPLWYPNWAPAVTESVVSVASILLSTLTLAVAGVPAAIAERLRGKRETDDLSAIIWFAGTVVLTLPAVPSLLRLGGAG
jgi:heme/copper-type cytochrome/quinol oxidase subunit 3